MARLVEEPVVTVESGPGDRNEVTRHPAFAQIGASRVSGRTPLYDSDFTHQAYMTVTIRRSELRRSLSNDWHFGKAELIQIAMSEAQWATFVSSPNVGAGVPCTINHLAGQDVPGLPEPKPRTHQFAGEVRKSSEESVAALDALAVAIDGMGLSKVKADTLKEYLRKARHAFTSTAPFIADQFDEHAEKTVQRAKAEVHGYMIGTLMRHGLAALEGDLPLLIEAKSEDAA